MRYLFIILIAMYPCFAQGQLEIPKPKLNTGSSGLPGGGILKSDGKLLPPPDSNPYPVKYNSSKTTLGKTKSETRIEREVNPNAVKIDLDKNKEYYKVFQRDQYLGDATTNLGTVRVSCRDHEYVDGDKIRIYLNKRVIVSELTLKGEPTILEIKLEEEFNTIEFEALNEGLSPPNTAELKVFDANGVLLFSEQWNIAKGYRASASILKLPSAK